MTLAQIHLRPLCYLGNSQSGVHVVRKTALNYSERENFQADLWSYSEYDTPPDMGLARHQVTAIHLTHRNHLWHICTFFAKDVFYN